METRNLAGKTALVTGAASGIGKETALEIARRGANLALCDVNEAGLEDTASAIRTMGREVIAARVDVSKPDEMSAFADTVHAQVEAVDLLVNNAGIAIIGGALDMSLEDWDSILGVNLHGVVHGCHFFVPNMVKRGQGGHVVIISSAAGYTPIESLVAYCTTKYGVLGMAESMAAELARHGIGVTAICPGLIDTPIVKNSPMRGAYATPGLREQMLEGYQRRSYTPDRVARNILRAVAKNRIVAPIAAESWLMYYAKRISPSFIRWVSGKVSDRSRKMIESISEDS